MFPGITLKFRMMKRWIITFWVMVGLFLLGCSPRQWAIRQTVPVLEHGVQAIFAEPDLQLARLSIPANLKLMEGLWREDPKNKALLLNLTRGYASYALAFLEDTSEARASQLYLRSRNFGFQLLQLYKPFEDGIPEDDQALAQKLRQLDAGAVPAVFWTAFAWAGWVNLNSGDPRAVADLNRVEAMMRWVQQTREDYFFGAVHLFFGSVYGSLPRMLGGDPEKARQEFERCLEISDGRFLLANIYLARYYAYPLLDEGIFEDVLQRVLNAPDDILPGFELLTAVAKAKARWLLSRKDELF